MKKYLNVPNVLSASRILLFPVLIWMAYERKDQVFAWLFLFSLITDLADGIIARRFNLITAFGSRLDSIGDLCNYAAALAGIFFIFWSDVQAHALGFTVLFGLYFLQLFIMLLKFRKMIGMHLYVSKFTGYVHGIFLLSWFFFGFNEIFYTAVLITGIYSFSEEIALTLLLKKPDQDLKSLYWVIRNRKDLWKSNTK
jgi:cardiolipin synthase